MHRFAPRGVRGASASLVPLLVAILSFLLAPAAMAQDEVRVSIKADRTQAAPGAVVPIAVVFDHAEGWHVHTNAPKALPGIPEGTLIATEIKLTPPPGVVASAVQWPAPKTVMVDLSGSGTPTPYEVFGGRSIAFVAVRIPADAALGSSLSIPVEVGFQACNDRLCLAPDSTTATIALAIAASPAAAAADPDFAGFDIAAAVQSIEAGGPPPVLPATAAADGRVKFDAFGYGFTLDASGAVGLTLLLLVAAVGGFLLNLTPCVLPVVPIKIMGLAQAAKNPARCFYLGSVMSLGVIAFWMAIGLAIATISGFSAISSLFQTPWFSLVVGLFVLVMAVGMLGLFTISLPQSVYMVNPSHDTPGGSFLFGIMTAVLSTPCTAPFMGSAAAWAATQSPAITLATFAAIGAGMALPYWILSAFPKLVSRVPRTGPASELVKQVMGLLMVAVAIFFLWIAVVGLVPSLPAHIKVLHWWAILAIVALAMGWMVWRTFKITPSTSKRAVFTAIALLILGPAALFANQFGRVDKSIPWQTYQAGSVERLLEQGQVVVVEFTADWCLNCKALEAAVLSRKEVVQALNQPGVVPVKVDLTARQAAGWQKLKELGEVGIPLLAIRGPGQDSWWKSNAYTPEQVVEQTRAALSGAKTASR